MSQIFYKRLLYVHLVQNPSLKSFSTTVATVCRGQPLSFTVQYLINSCGLSLETALSTSKQFQLDESKPDRYDSVLTLLKTHGFSKTHIAELIKKHPSVLLINADKILKPKMEFLLGFGFSDSAVSDLVISNPSIFDRSLKSRLKPSLDILMKHVQSKEEVLKAIKRSSWLITFNLSQTLQPNVELLIKEGVPISGISKLIVHQPRVLLQKTDRLVSTIETVKKLDIRPTITTFVYAIHVLSSMSELTWNRKIELFKGFGWSEEEVMLVFRRDPYCLACSEGKVKKVMEFLMGTMKLHPSVMISNPKVLKHGLETRIRPRYMVLKVLELEKLIEGIDGNKKFSRVFGLAEETFLVDYVLKYLGKVPNLMDLYCASVAANSVDTNGPKRIVSHKVSY
ncbi:PREDICTED: transcription termination factor MTERF15, mitochondrial-like [Nelumbo nucifera]|uniref:Transcription termination factor MTERF15, mitochondrial-like n=1 Tax=Nelumbo nucifera TaxID=4432 RepID=A0A1U7ZE34_NELNU|nr:PREDICTED: transcription termination factor MTERF15, mitochondrial-like [Nelumbo nucifera]